MADFFKKYILLNTKDYIPEGIEIYLGPIVVAFTLGVCIALFAGHFRRKSEYLLLKALLKRQAVGESCAATLTALGLSRKGSVVRLLRSPGKTALLVKTVEQECPSPENSEKPRRLKDLPPPPDPRSASYFLTDETRKSAKALVANGKPSLFRPILLSVVCLAIGFGILMALPAILSLFA